MIELGFQFEAMACPCELRLVGPDEARLHAAADAAMAEVRRIEAKYSRYRPGNLLARLSAAAGTGVLEAVDEETAGLVNFAGALHRLSDGRFDATAGVLRRAWNFAAGRPPRAQDVAALLPLIGWHRVHWADGRLGLPQAGMELDFGGFGKEYAADRAAEMLAAHGVRGGFVELGGDIRVVGPRASGAPWIFGIAHPRRAGALLADVALDSGGLATSGDYERFFEHQGRRYSHLLDARTGYPVSGWQSVSVIAPTCAAAGAVATLACLDGSQGKAFLSDQAVPHLAVCSEGNITVQGPWRLVSTPDSLG